MNQSQLISCQILDVSICLLIGCFLFDCLLVLFFIFNLLLKVLLYQCVLFGVFCQVKKPNMQHIITTITVITFILPLCFNLRLLPARLFAAIMIPLSSVS